MLGIEVKPLLTLTENDKVILVLQLENDGIFFVKEWEEMVTETQKAG